MGLIRIAVKTGRWDLAAHAIVLVSARAAAGGGKHASTKEKGKETSRRAGNGNKR